MPEAEFACKSEIKKKVMIFGAEKEREKEKMSIDDKINFIIEFNEDGAPIDCHKVCYLFIF